MKIDIIRYLKRNLQPDPDIDLTNEVLEHVAELERKAASLDKIRAADARYKSTPKAKQKRKGYMKVYYQENKEAIDAKNKKWCEKNKERVREYAKEWRTKNADKIRESRKKYAEYYRKYARKWRAAHPDYHKEYYQKLKNSAKTEKV